MSAPLAAAVAEAEARYVAANPASNGLHVERQRSMPGGNTRTVIHVAPFPLTIAKASGATITDVDDHVYADFLGEYTAGLYGHSHPIILGAVREALADGICFGAPERVRGRPRRRGLRALPVDRPGPVHQLRHRGEHARHLAGARAHRSRGHPGVRGRLPRRRVLLRHGCRLAHQRPVPDDHGPVQRRRGCGPADRGERRPAGRRHRRAAAGQRRLHPGRAGLPGGAARGHHRARRRADLRRGDDVAPVARRPAADHRRHARSDVARQVRRRRHDVRRVRRPGRADGAVRSRPAPTRSPTPARSTTTC